MVELVEGLVSALYYKRTFPRTNVQDLRRQYRAQAWVWVPVVACHSDSAPPPPSWSQCLLRIPEPCPPACLSVRPCVGGSGSRLHPLHGRLSLHGPLLGTDACAGVDAEEEGEEDGGHPQRPQQGDGVTVEQAGQQDGQRLA